MNRSILLMIALGMGLNACGMIQRDLIRTGTVNVQVVDAPTPKLSEKVWIYPHEGGYSVYSVWPNSTAMRNAQGQDVLIALVNSSGDVVYTREASYKRKFKTWHRYNPLILREQISALEADVSTVRLVFQPVP